MPQKHTPILRSLSALALGSLLALQAACTNNNSTNFGGTATHTLRVSYLGELYDAVTKDKSSAVTDYLFSRADLHQYKALIKKIEDSELNEEQEQLVLKKLETIVEARQLSEEEKIEVLIGVAASYQNEAEKTAALTRMARYVQTSNLTKRQRQMAFENLLAITEARDWSGAEVWGFKCNDRYREMEEAYGGITKAIEASDLDEWQRQEILCHREKGPVAEWDNIYPRDSGAVVPVSDEEYKDEEYKKAVVSKGQSHILTRIARQAEKADKEAYKTLMELCRSKRISLEKLYQIVCQESRYNLLKEMHNKNLASKTLLDSVLKELDMANAKPSPHFRNLNELANAMSRTEFSKILPSSVRSGRTQECVINIAFKNKFVSPKDITAAIQRQPKEHEQRIYGLLQELHKDGLVTAQVIIEGLYQQSNNQFLLLAPELQNLLDYKVILLSEVLQAALESKAIKSDDKLDMYEDILDEDGTYLQDRWNPEHTQAVLQALLNIRLGIQNKFDCLEIMHKKGLASLPIILGAIVSNEHIEGNDKKIFFRHILEKSSYYKPAIAALGKDAQPLLQKIVTKYFPKSAEQKALLARVPAAAKADMLQANTKKSARKPKSGTIPRLLKGVGAKLSRKFSKSRQTKKVVNQVTGGVQVDTKKTAGSDN